MMKILNLKEYKWDLSSEGKVTVDLSKVVAVHFAGVTYTELYISGIQGPLSVAEPYTKVLTDWVNALTGELSR